MYSRSSSKNSKLSETDHWYIKTMYRKYRVHGELETWSVKDWGLLSDVCSSGVIAHRESVTDIVDVSRAIFALGENEEKGGERGHLISGREGIKWDRHKRGTAVMIGCPSGRGFQVSGTTCHGIYRKEPRSHPCCVLSKNISFPSVSDSGWGEMMIK